MSQLSQIRIRLLGQLRVFRYHLSFLIALSFALQPIGAQSGPAVLTRIIPEGLDGSVRVELRIDREVPFEAVSLHNPERVYIDLDGTVADQGLVNGIIDVPIAPLSRVRIGQYQFSVARVVFDLERKATFRTYYLTDPFRIIIEFEPPSRSPEIIASPPKAEPPKSSRTSLSSESLNGVRVSSDPDQTSIDLIFSGPVQYTTGKLPSPARFYFDFPKTRIGKGLPTHQYPVNDPRLRRVRIGQNQKDLIRVVFDMPNLSEPQIERLESGSRVHIVFRNSNLTTVHLSNPEISAPNEPDLPPDRKPIPRAGERVIEPQPAPIDLSWGLGSLEVLPLRFHTYTVFSAPQVRKAAVSLPAASPTKSVDVPGSKPPVSPDTGEPTPLLLDELVVRINSDYVTLSELNSELALLKAEIIEQFASEEDINAEYDRRKRLALKEMVERRLLAERAQIEGLGEGIDEQVDTFIQNVCEQTGLPNESALDRVLRSRGTSISRYRHLVKERLYAELLLQHVVETKGALLDIEVLRYYQANTDRFMKKGQIELAEIFLERGTRNSQQLTEKVGRVQSALSAGETFEATAALYSDGPTAAEAGGLGTFDVGSLDPDIETVVDRLEVGQVSEPIEKEAGIQFIKLLNRLPATPRPYGEVSSIIRQELQEEKIKRVLADFIDKLWQDSFVVLMPAYEGQYQLPVRP